MFPTNITFMVWWTFLWGCRNLRHGAETQMLNCPLKGHTTSSLWRTVLVSLRQLLKHSCRYGLPYGVTHEVGYQPPALVSLGWYFTRPLWRLCRTRTISLITPRCGFVITLQNHVQVYSHCLSLSFHTRSVPLNTCCSWMIFRVGGWAKMKPMALPRPKRPVNPSWRRPPGFSGFSRKIPACPCGFFPAYIPYPLVAYFTEKRDKIDIYWGS